MLRRRPSHHRSARAAERRVFSLRYILLATTFCLVSVIFLGRLFYIQISGKDGDYLLGTTHRDVIIQASRGEIYDRNGNCLVKNVYTNNLTLSYSAVSQLERERVNQICLKLLGGLTACGAENTHTENFFPMDGVYPNYRYSAAATDGDSTIYYRLQRVLSDLKLDENLSAKDLINHYIERNNLLGVDAGGERLYTDSEVGQLIRLYYDMDALRFEKSAIDYVFAKDIDINLITYVKELGFTAVNILYDASRYYCYPGYASHILGAVGPIYAEEWDYYNEQGYQMNAIVGKSGCEAAFEEYLHGEDGKMRIIEDSRGNVVETRILKEAVPGSDVYLTLDINLQIAAEDGLKENVRRVGTSRAGASVTMDAADFGVLAVASYPTYDLSDHDYTELLNDPNSPLLNRAINGIYTPGSTFKLGIAAAALTEGVIDASSTVTCTGKYQGVLGCSTYSTAGFEHHTVNVVSALAVSCNSFFSEMGHRLGIDRIESYMSQFGFGKSTGLELGGAVGTLAGPTYRKSVHGDEWQEGNTWQAAIGQADTQASPLQIASYVSTLMNGGTRYSAHLLYCVCRSGQSEPDYTYTQSEETILDRLNISASTLSTICSGMRKVVTGNSTVSAYMKNVPAAVGGKTGTAQTGSALDNGLFVGTAPYDNPEVVVVTVIEKGNSGTAAAYTAGKVLEAYYQNKK